MKDDAEIVAGSSVSPGALSKPGLVNTALEQRCSHPIMPDGLPEIQNSSGRHPHPCAGSSSTAAHPPRLTTPPPRNLPELLKDLASEGVTMVFARVQWYLEADLKRHGLTKTIGKSRFPRLRDAMAAFAKQDPALPQVEAAQRKAFNIATPVMASQVITPLNMGPRGEMNIRAIMVSVSSGFRIAGKGRGGSDESDRIRQWRTAPGRPRRSGRGRAPYFRRTGARFRRHAITHQRRRGAGVSTADFRRYIMQLICGDGVRPLNV